MPLTFEQRIDELLQAGVIDPDTHQRIRNYYATQKQPASLNRTILVFGILGALLVGLGAILIIAHNWDTLPRLSRLIIAFLPLIASQLFCGWTIFGDKARPALKEIAVTCLFFAIGACLALVSQIYHIEGSLANFLLAWAALYIPVIYLARSSIASLLAVALAAYYGFTAGIMSYQHPFNWYFALMAAIAPYYLLLLRRQPFANTTVFHHWLIPISLTIMLGTVAGSGGNLLFPAYVNLFSVFYLAGNLPLFREQKRRLSGYLVLGSLGIIVTLLICSFDFLWQDLASTKFNVGLYKSGEVYAFAVTLLAAIGMLVYVSRLVPDSTARPLQYVFAVFLVIFIIGYFDSKLPQILVNLLLLVLSILVIRKGIRTDRLEILNYGLLILSAQVLCRFFDTEISFLLRGLLFISVGTGFFVANYQMISRRKSLNPAGKNPLS